MLFAFAEIFLDSAYPYTHAHIEMYSLRDECQHFLQTLGEHPYTMGQIIDLNLNKRSLKQ